MPDSIPVDPPDVLFEKMRHQFDNFYEWYVGRATVLSLEVNPYARSMLLSVQKLLDLARDTAVAAERVNKIPADVLEELHPNDVREKHRAVGGYVAPDRLEP